MKVGPGTKDRDRRPLISNIPLLPISLYTARDVSIATGRNPIQLRLRWFNWGIYWMGVGHRMKGGAIGIMEALEPQGLAMRFDTTELSVSHICRQVFSM